MNLVICLLVRMIRVATADLYRGEWCAVAFAGRVRCFRRGTLVVSVSRWCEHSVTRLLLVTVAFGRFVVPMCFAVLPDRYDSVKGKFDA